jgi:hypothetical protein
MANTQVSDRITFQIVEIEGRSIAGIKLLGLLTEAQYGQEDFSLYVRWDEAHGIVTVDRSDTDERILTQGLTRVGKLEGFQNLMHLLAAKYGTDVVVAADPGLKVSAMAAKMIGTYAAPVAEVAPVVEDSTTQAFDSTNPATWAEANLPQGWAWLPAVDSDGEFHLISPDGVNMSAAYYAAQAAQADDMTIPTNAPVIEGYEWKRHVNPGESLWAGSTYQLITAGSVCGVVATVKHRGNGMWAAQSASWGSTILTHPGFWEGEPLADAFANVVKFMDFLTRARAAGLSALDAGRVDWRTWVSPLSVPMPSLGDQFTNVETGTVHTVTGVGDYTIMVSHDNGGASNWSHAWFGTWVLNGDMVPALDIPAPGEIETLMAERDAAMAEWVKPLIKIVSPLPIRTPGHTLDSWDMAESAIWAGTESLGSMRVRLPRKVKKAGRASRPRPIDVKRARIASGYVR